MLKSFGFAFATLLFMTACQAQVPPGSGSVVPNANVSSSASAAMPAMAVPPLKLRSAIGTNVAMLTYYSSQVTFVNIMKAASEWVSSDAAVWDNKKPLDLDTNDWVRSLAPGQIARTLMLRSNADRFPAGEYLVRYKGQGTLKFEFAARIVSQKPGEMVIQVTPQAGGIGMYITATDPTDYLRDIVITMPGGICEGDPFTHVASAQRCGARRFLSYADNSATILFYPPFLERSRAYSVLRFMDWMQTNNSKVINWSQRPLVSKRTWLAGVPIEIMSELSNRLGAHPWFTLPHQSNDTYARNFAQVLKSTLSPALRAYVEDSNEVWNAQFLQNAEETRQAAAQTPPLDVHQYHALRTRTMGEIFKAALGPSRVVTVLATQAASAYTATRGLEYLKKQFSGAPGIDAVAIAPYIPLIVIPAQIPTFNAMTQEALFGYVRGTVLPTVSATVRAYRNVANTYGVDLIAYEGGQHLVGARGAENDDKLAAVFMAFNRDPRIKQIYLDYLASWKANGGELFVHYFDVGLFSKWGSWGALEHLEQTRATAPKFDALQTFIEQNPVWWTQ